MAAFKTEEVLLDKESKNPLISPEIDWLHLPYDRDYDLDCTLEGAQSVPDLTATPFLGQPNYSTSIGTAPSWMSQNILNGGNPNLEELTGTFTNEDEHLHQEDIPQYSPAPSTSSSYFAFSESEERDATYNKLLESLQITESQLQKFSVKELNRFLKSNGLSIENQKCIKNRRRTLKNRGYAQNCRVKRINQKKSLELRNEALLKELDQLKADLEKVKKERNVFRNKLVQLVKFVKDEKLKAP